MAELDPCPDPLSLPSSFLSLPPVVRQSCWNFVYFFSAAGFFPPATLFSICRRSLVRPQSLLNTTATRCQPLWDGKGKFFFRCAEIKKGFLLLYSTLLNSIMLSKAKVIAKAGNEIFCWAHIYFFSSIFGVLLVFSSKEEQIWKMWTWWRGKQPWTRQLLWMASRWQGLGIGTCWQGCQQGQMKKCPIRSQKMAKNALWK